MTDPAVNYFFAQVLIPNGIYSGHILTAAVPSIMAPRPQSMNETGLCIANPALASTTPAMILMILSVDPIFSFNIINSFSDCSLMNLSFCSESDWNAGTHSLALTDSDKRIASFWNDARVYSDKSKWVSGNRFCPEIFWKSNFFYNQIQN